MHIYIYITYTVYVYIYIVYYIHYMHIYIYITYTMYVYIYIVYYIHVNSVLHTLYTYTSHTNLHTWNVTRYTQKRRGKEVWTKCKRRCERSVKDEWRKSACHIHTHTHTHAHNIPENNSRIVLASCTHEPTNLCSPSSPPEKRAEIALVDRHSCGRRSSFATTCVFMGAYIYICVLCMYVYMDICVWICVYVYTQTEMYIYRYM